MRNDPRTREVFESSAQHLRHAGFDYAEIGKLLGGMSAARARELAASAERRRPKLCRGACWTPASTRAWPLCPYCEHCWMLADSIPKIAGRI